jgi:hypothetical protein
VTWSLVTVWNRGESIVSALATLGAKVLREPDDISVDELDEMETEFAEKQPSSTAKRSLKR